MKVPYQNTGTDNMCGRFCIAASPGEINERYGVSVPPEYRPCYNLSPGNTILVIIREGESNKAHRYEWGIRTNQPHLIINARIETIQEKFLFRDSFQNHRCLIPASGYYEWKYYMGRKTPFYFSSRLRSLISFAGFIRHSSERDQVVIITARSIPPYADIHDRMPVILHPSQEPAYLKDGSISVIYEPLDSYEVSSRVNQVEVDEPGLIIPRKPGSGQMTLGNP